MGLQIGHNDEDDRAAPARASGVRSTDAAAGVERPLAEARERVASLESSLAAQARAHSDLIHLLCHELRTPITVISGFARLLMDPTNGLLSDRQLGFANETLKAAQRLNGLVGDMLEASPESGAALAVDLKPGDVNTAIYSMLASLSPLWADKTLRVEMDLDPGLPDVAMDTARIEQVLTNLLTNAIRYGREEGVVRVGSMRCPSPDVQAVEIYVEDDGPGIGAADRERVFEPYVRGDHASDRAGLGIGLAICHRILASHGGSIRVEESSLGGARFVFELPFAPGASEEYRGGVEIDGFR